MATKTKKAGSSDSHSSTILYRSETNKVLGGVCGGLGEVFNIDPTLVRILFVLGTLFGGSGILFYAILWIVIPSRSKLSKTSDENIRENLDEMKERVHSFSHDFGHRESSRPAAGIILLVLGLLFLAGNFGYLHFNWGRLWPVFLIIPGIMLLSRRD